MAQSSLTIGRVTADLELQTSTSQNSYVQFTLAERIRYGHSARIQFPQVWAWGEKAKNLIKGKVKKGSLIWISGSIELEEYMRKDGITTDKRLKIIMDRWGYVASGKPNNGETEAAPPEEPEHLSPLDGAVPDGEIDGDREFLPG